MNRIEFSEFFSRYLDPHKAQAAEWGAFAGLHGRSSEPALQQVRKLAATALARAGLGAPDRLVSARERLSSIEASRASIRQRLSAAYYRLIGTTPFSSAQTHRVIIEGVIDLLAFPCLPVALLASWPLAAVRRWSLNRIERAEGAVARLGKAAEDYLTIEFEWHFAKGEEARCRRTRSPGWIPGDGEKTKEYHHEEAAGRVS
jgi:hypothetical protein